MSAPGLDELERQVVRCRSCPRLVDWRERVAREKRAAFRDEEYWGRPVPGFGDPAARVYVLGLAPAAHGDRTGRVFTGDRSGDWLFASLHRIGFANQPTSAARDDGLRLLGAFVAAAVRCAPPANKPLPSERDNCLPYAAREWRAPEPARDRLPGRLRVGRRVPRSPDCGRSRASGTAPRSHGGGPALLGTYHPSQQNTFTGRLTEDMLDAVFERARELAG